jgi:hypothetical protein
VATSQKANDQEVDAVLAQVGVAFGGIELKVD